MSNDGRFVIAGATGRVGSAVADALIERGEPVTILARRIERASAWSARGARVEPGDLGDANALAGSLRGAAGFFVLLPEDPTAPDFHAPRRRQTEAIVAAVRESGVPRVVMISAIGAYLSERCGPIADLNGLERGLASSGTVFTAVRATYFQDNVAGMIPLAEAKGIFPCFLPSADAPFPTVAVRDAGAVVADLLAARPARGEIVDLLGPLLSVRRQAEALGAALGRPLQVVEIPPPGRVDALMQSGMSRSAAEAIAEMFGAFGEGLVVPRGDRRMTGTTTIEATLAGAIAARRGPA